MSYGFRSVGSQMHHSRQLNSYYKTCIICGLAMKVSIGAIKTHLWTHKNVLDKKLPPYIAALMTNIRGCNAMVDRLDPEDKQAVINFVKMTEESMLRR